jgi:hypothetical protein
MPKSTLAKPLYPFRSKLQLIVVIVAATALGYIVVRSLAATQTVAFEAESGANSANAQVVAKANASGGQVVTFATSATVTPTPVPTVTPSPTPVPNDALTAADLTRLTQLKIYFAHQSVGDNIVQGLPEIYSSYGVGGLKLTDSNTTGSGGFFADDYVGQNGDPLGKISDFNTMIRSGIGSRVQVAFFKFCFVDVYDGTNVQAIFNSYQSTMNSLVASYPNVKFLYVTNPLTITSDAADNANREKLNQLIRNAYGSTGRLFDLAQVESTQPNGTRVTSTYNGSTVYGLYSGYTSDGGHLNQAGRDAAAKALLTVIANVTR